MIKHIAFTLYPVKDVAAARKFYEQDLGLTLGKDFGGKWVEYYLDNGCFAISNMTPGTPSASQGGSISFEVDDLDKTVADLKAKGAKILADIFHSPVCRMAVVADPSGNGVVLHQKK